MNKKSMKKLWLSAMCATLCLGVMPLQAKVIEQESPSSILRPYTFGFGSAQDGDEGASAMIAETGMEHLTFTDSSGYSINYWAYVPKDDNGEPIANLPVFVYMHGYSDGGGDNNIAVRYHNAIVFRLLQLRDDPKYQAIILVPQTPNATNPEGESDYFKDQWVGIRGDDKWSQWNIPTWDMSTTPRTANLNAVVELIKATQEATNADADRAYVSGISMGGCTVWDLISRDDSHMFAAAVPICGIGDPNLAENAKDVPIRMYHGSVDDTINVVSSRIMYDELRKYGNVTYTEYSAEAHPSWNSAYSPTLDDDGDGEDNLDDLIAWMFNQSRSGTLDGSVDTDPLSGVIWDAQQETQEDYRASRFAQLQAEAERAQRLLDDGDEEQIKESIRLLDAIMHDAQADQDAVQRMLERAVLRAQRIMESGETGDELADALELAQAANGQAEQLSAYLVLEAALQEAGDERDLMELERLDEDLTQLDLSVYPNAQQEAIDKAHEQAQQVLQAAQADQEAIDEAYARILKSLDEEIQIAQDLLDHLLDQGQTALNNAAAYDQEDVRWSAFVQAYEAASALRDDPYVQADQIAQAALTLADAYADLRLLPDEDKLAQLNAFLDQVEQLDRALYSEAALKQIDAAAAQARALIEDFDEERFAAFLPQLEQAQELIADMGTRPSSPDTGAAASFMMPLGLLAASAQGLLMMRRRRCGKR